MDSRNSIATPSWLYNFFLHVLHNVIKDAAEKGVGSAIQNLLNHVRAYPILPLH